ncbi:cytochrome P450 [Penicillium chermesinum]|uniref:Cytochrome P450 n=1 Tax=Penicillium chermesinum TaxID=63820 RepID=A0A9W9NH97_9EURO|nr:cytochrome P450 [Penicillium chermesinum]KAJ5219975.1 cytochrome P450 [Penicillium chermesinum]KAJ6157433.1 cytochrome P450 [Penicillium chermesinum]
MLSGKSHLAIEELHRQYGPIVRISPNELSLGSAESLKAIYGHNPGRPHPKRGSFYNFLNAGFSKFNLVSEPDPHRHSEMRKLLLSAFSQRALLQQELVLGGVVDQWLKILEKKAGPGSAGANITRWYDFGSLDVLGELAFGESFHAVETEQLDARLNLAINPYLITIIDNIRHIKFLSKVFTNLVPPSVFLENPNSRFSRQQVDKYDGLLRDFHSTSLDDSRRDFVFPLAQKVRSGEMDKEEMASNMFVFSSVAGQDTTSVALAATTYLLLKHPDKLEQVVTEIRQAFGSYERIRAQEAQQLRYLQAVVHESMRILPPVSAGHALPRYSNGFELHGKYIPPGVEVFSSPWTIAHDPEYFKDPMEFKPERWLDPDSTDLKEASQPFSIGPNACIGKRYCIPRSLC